MSDLAKTPQEQIRYIRESTGLSRIDFCKKYGIPLRTMEEWESGRRTPPEYIPRMLYYYVRYASEQEMSKLNAGIRSAETEGWVSEEDFKKHFIKREDK